MMTLNLNLLPDSVKKSIRLLVKLHFVRVFLLYLSGVLFLLLAFLFSVNYVLEEQLNSLVNNPIYTKVGYGEYNKEVADTNKKIKDIVTAGEHYGLLTPRFFQLADSVPPDIQLRQITLGWNSTEITLPGTAKTRQGLLDYEKKLQGLPWVEKTDLPTSQLLQKENISFQMKLTIKPTTLEELEKTE